MRLFIARSEMLETWRAISATGIRPSIIRSPMICQSIASSCSFMIGDDPNSCGRIQHQKYIIQCGKRQISGC